jgi:hypothetical protein
MVESQAAVAEVQQRIGELVEVLQRLGDRPQIIADLDAALDARDLDQFRAAMEVGGIRPPGDKCDPYVTALIVVLKPARLVRRCFWKAQTLQPTEGEQLAQAVVGGAEAERMLEILLELGLIECHWVREEQMDLLEVKRFVQGMCPPGTF